MREAVANPMIAEPDDTGAFELIALASGKPLFAEEIRTRVAAGARLVRFEICISLLLFTIRRQSAVYLTESWQDRYLRGLGYSLTSLLLGPWGVPWGLMWTPWSVWVNLSGGVDETENVLAQLRLQEKPADPLFRSVAHVRENRP